MRSPLIGCRTQLSNQIRGLLAEYGIVLPQHIAQLRRHLPELLEDENNELTASTRCLFHSLYEELVELARKIAAADERIDRTFRDSAECQRIAAVEGIGPVTATAVVAAISDGRAFRNGGSSLPGWVWYRGNIPAEARSGCWGSANAAIYLRTLLVHGARSVVYRAKLKTDRRSCWINDKQATRNGKSLRRIGQQERAHSVVASGEAADISASSLGSAQLIERSSVEMLESYVMAKVVRPASSEPAGGGAVQGR